MKVTNKLTEQHKTHQIETRRAKPNSPHYGFYHCITCNKFVTWITKEVYNLEKRSQKHQDIMWFGKYQGKPIQELPQDYLEWAVTNIKVGVEKLQHEHTKRQVNKER